MTDAILVFDGTAESPRYRWFAPGSGAPAEGSAADAASVFAGAGAATVLLTSAHVLLTEVQVKVRNRRLLGGAVAYALEDRLADDVEVLLFEVAPAEAGTYPVAVAARALVAAVSEDLAGAAFASVRCVPYVFAVPQEPAHDCALHDGRLTIVRTGPYRGFTAPASAVEPIRSRLAGEHPGRGSLVHYAHAQAGPIAAADEAPLSIAAASFNDWLQRNLAAGPLLQFTHGEGEKRSGSERKFAIAAALLLAALIVHTGFVYSKTATNEQRLAKIEQDTRAVFTQAFPNVKRIVNPRVQANRLLGELVDGQARGSDFSMGCRRLGRPLQGSVTIRS